MTLTVEGGEQPPRHVACVMDGNGRWAQQRGLKRTDGHTAGKDALLDVVDGALDQGIEWLTLYAFSTENWRRPTDEVRFLMRFNEALLLEHRDELHEKGVRIRFIGRRDWKVPRRLLRRIDESVAMTAGNRKLTLTVAFNYGSQAEIVDAVRQIVASGADPGDIDEATIAKYLYDPEMPDVDLWVRTSGEYRISNFLIWQSAYAELVFVDTFWPDFRGRHLADAVQEFHSRNRRFGGLTE
ncbi:MAG: polyprenyl diphosphate synthase [Actinomycetota bacterium]